MPCQVELNTFDRKVLNYIYKYSPAPVLKIQNDFGRDMKWSISNSLRKLANRGLISYNQKNSSWYPVCSQVIA
jgi:predicted transcriptional regulator